LQLHGVADFERFHLGNKAAFELLRNFIEDDKSLRCDAGLTIVDDSGLNCRGNGLIEIRMRRNDEWIAAAKLEHNLFYTLRGRHTDLNAGALATGQCSRRDAIIRQ